MWTRASIAGKRYQQMVKQVLNSKKDKNHTLIDTKDKEYWAKVKFNSGANIAKLGIVSGFSNSTE